MYKKQQLNAVLESTGSNDVFNSLPEWKQKVIKELYGRGFKNARIAYKSDVTDKFYKKKLAENGITKVNLYKECLMGMNKSYRNELKKVKDITEEQELTLNKRIWGKKFSNSLVINDARYEKDKEGNRISKLPNRMYLPAFTHPACVYKKKYTDQFGQEIDDIVIDECIKPVNNDSPVKGYGEYNVDNIVGVKFGGKYYGEFE